jgi:hypothetical protein
MTARTYATQANAPAGPARVRVFRQCPAMPAVVSWSPSVVGIDTDKHGRPRRTEVPHP